VLLVVSVRGAGVVDEVGRGVWFFLRNLSRMLMGPAWHPRQFSAIHLSKF
jgi:hypothetical protein